jgi:hypothetical protein
VKDDEALAALAAAARSDPDARRPSRWERLAAGEASDDERASLERVAQSWDEPDAVAVLSPDRAFAERVASRVAAQRAASAAPATVVPLRRARVVVVAAAVVAAVAMAASVALIAGRSRTADLPTYAMVTEGGQRDIRSGSGASDAVVRLGPDSNLDLAMRPQKSVVGAVEVRAAIVMDGRARPWTPSFEIASSGAVSLHGAATALVDGSNGVRDLVIAVGRPGEVPLDPEAIAHAESDAHLRVMRARVEIVGR